MVEIQCGRCGEIFEGHVSEEPKLEEAFCKLCKEAVLGILKEY